MHYIEPCEATIAFDTLKMTGILSGSLESVKFESNDEEFIKHFPTGNFDTLSIDEKNCTQRQQDIIEVARSLVRQMLD